jgi:hypothetical protein
MSHVRYLHIKNRLLERTGTTGKRRHSLKTD